MNRLFLLLIVAALVAALRADARACSLAGPTPHVIDPSMQATDQAPPTLPPLPSARVTRGKPTVGCGSRSTCDDIGTIGIAVDATDDVTPAERIGYRLTLESGQPPSALILPTDAVEPVSGELVLVWDDIADGRTEDFNFTLRITAVDLAGNESDPQRLPISTGTGTACAVAGAPTPGGELATLVASALALAMRWRRRR